MFSLTNKVALVTGAGRGLGLEMAKGLSRAGAYVYINGRNHQQLQAMSVYLQQQGHSIYPLSFDVENNSQLDCAFQSLKSAHGGLDILVNNVGVRDRRGMFDLDEKALRRLLDNHVVSAYQLTRYAAPLMTARQYGRVINIASIAAYRAVAGDIAYIAAKGALVAMTRAQAAELGVSGITVNAIAPGAFATESNEVIASSELGQHMLQGHSCLQRWGRPEEIAGAAVFLASTASSYITGQVLAVDGGVLAHY